MFRRDSVSSMAKRKVKVKKASRKPSRKAAKTVRRKTPRAGEIRAESVMVTAVVTVREDLSVSALIREISNRKFSGFPVVDADERAVGVVSQNDVLRALAYAVGAEAPPADAAGRRKASAHLLEITNAAAGGAVSELLSRPVRDVMDRSVASCRPETRIADVFDTMVSKRVHRMVVVDADRKVRGLISTTDLMRRLGKSLR